MKVELTKENIEKHKPLCGTNKYPCKGKRRIEREYQFIRADYHVSELGPSYELQYVCKACERKHIVEVDEI